MKDLSKVAGILVLVGAINWGLIGLLDFNLVTSLLGADTVYTRVVYLLVGLSALYVAYDMYGNPKAAKSKK